MRLAAALLVVALAPLAAAQPSPLTVVRGRVVAAGDAGGDAASVALRGARVAVVGGAASAPVFTDGEGRFAIGITGAARLKVSKAGFAPALVDVGAGAPASVEIALPRGAVISGTVIDELGFPVSDAAVRASRLDPPPGAAAASVVTFVADTDEEGNYRIGSLPAGRYSVSSERAMSRVTMMMPEGPENPQLQLRLNVLRRELDARIVPLSDAVTIEARAGQVEARTLQHRRRAVSPPDAPIGGFATGTVLDEFGEPLEGVDVRLRRVRYVNDRLTAQMPTLAARTDDRGQFRVIYAPPGRYVVEVAAGDAGFAPVFYPGVTSVAAAVPVTIGRQQEVPGLTVSFVRAPESRVYGFAIGADGEALRGNVSLTASLRSGALALPVRFAPTDASGVFEFLNVPPGEYVLRATGGNWGAPTEFAAQFVRVDGAEVPPITIAAAPTSTIAGRVVLDGPAAGVSPRTFSLTVVPDGDYGADPRQYSIIPADDGTFTARGLAGQLRFVLVNNPGNWWLKSVDIGGTNAADVPVRLGGRDSARTDVAVVVAPTAATVAGRVTGERGEPLDDYRVIVFAADRARWFARSPYVRLGAGPDADGGFTMRGVPPGDYFVAAVDAVDGDATTGEWQSPEFLDALRTRAERMAFDENERAAINLRVVRSVR